MKIATLNKGKETKYLNHYPLIDEDDIYAHDHLKERRFSQNCNCATAIYCYGLCRTPTQRVRLGIKLR